MHTRKPTSGPLDMEKRDYGANEKQRYGQLPSSVSMPGISFFLTVSNSLTEKESEGALFCHLARC